MPRVVMYSTGLCPYCFLAKRLLERRAIPYEEHRMSRSERERLAPLGGGLTFPQLVFGDRVVDGWTELRQLDRSGELDRIAKRLARPPEPPRRSPDSVDETLEATFPASDPPPWWAYGDPGPKN